MKAKILWFVFLMLAPAWGFSRQGQLQSFPLAQVRLLEGPFKQAQQTDLAYMLSLDMDRLLAPFQKEAGIQPKAQNYGNWENTGLDGHIGGHYLSALALMYAATGNPEVQQRLTYMVDALEACQQKSGDGYLGGTPGGKEMWQDIKAGKIDAGSFSLNKKWVPWYNIHKTYAGLRDAYVFAGNEKARQMLIKLSDWCLDLTANLSDAQIQDMLRSEHGGMNEVFADVAEITGDPKYLVLAKSFSQTSVLNPLLQGKDVLNGMHANTQIPKVIGFQRVAEVSGDKTWTPAAEFFWQTVVKNRTVSIGGNSVSEHFHPANNFSSMLEGKEGPETCNTYNMLKLSKQLYLASASAEYLNYYERAMYNHILSSQHPTQGGFVYFTPMRPRHYRVYSQPQLDFWCCVGSGLENHGKYGELIYAHSAKDLYVNLFLPSVLEWKEKGVTLTQNTKFPFEESSALTFALKKTQKFTLYIRYPEWVEAGQLRVTVNGKAAKVTQAANGYLGLDRKWKSGDVVTVSLPMHTKAEYLPDGSPWVSFVHGPLVLAAVTDTTGLKGLRADGSRMGHVANGPLYSLEEAPLLVSAGKDVAAGIQPVAGKPFTFTASSLLHQEQYKQLELVPFYQIHDARYTIYFPVTSPEGLEARKAALKEKETAKLALEAQTIDQVAPGEQQPESDHGFAGEQTETGVFKDRHWRHARGWFSYTLKNKGPGPRRLRLMYYGKDKDRHFTISVNGQVLATEKLAGTGGDKFMEVDYEIPAAVLEKAKGGELKLEFKALPNSTTAGIYYVRLLR
ncbi:acetyl-CoA carboxylase [Rufibacter radiotolerans]|uniref:Acetyl-CoA carboxylase n=1 Tax=Rufibacter radiotolerans TaxID=1379910 RepID=A0A0H4VTW6_9BACT|nr:glycoside hydrolase family 127 protein [Rufibacter radiotolerans]AKQ47387.1 acetyl-CoA carboxylase [Rufibacter radiotolerans]